MVFNVKQEPSFASKYICQTFTAYDIELVHEMKLKELIKSNYVIVPSVLNIRSEKYDME